jgi:peptidoglycan/xylan/chitin deacetylase (PgdA/CDA1 family)
MAVDPTYLQDPYKKPGYDHERYGFSNLFQRKPVQWPGGARVALWIVPRVEFFPIDMKPKPFVPVGGMERPWPDYWNYTLRDYGNRVGIFRIFEAIASRGLKATVAINSRAAERMPIIVRETVKHGWEVMAHGIDMGKLHYDGQSAEEEEAQIRTCLASLRQLSGQRVNGWMSPAQHESFNTPDLLARQGIEYQCDWGNDELPYRMQTKTGELYAMPQALEIADLRLLHTYKHRTSEFVEELMDHFTLLYREAEKHGGRIMSLSLTPWWIGMPHRIGALEEALDRMLDYAGVWPATSAEILASWKAQQ